MLDHISVKGARANNLKNIDVTIPRDKLVVLTGLSGSGKSSLAFDTIYAEGQRRYAFGPQNTMEEAKYLCDVLEEVIPRRRAMSCMWLQGQNTARHFSLKGEN